MLNNLDAEQLKKVTSNPFYCLPQIDEIFVQEHEPLITEDEWIAANVNLINEVGAKQWLILLLENLKGNYV
ncbi:hypothetical protein GFS24_16920 [Chitinophaga sp. SYP-B3965]|uniref:hypothetical protein n=1 Tax=Chitinophaga sp. SYP-B3965 TaxID=2663120 RepID=UPI001299E3FC|nr:hypothetical protein [Chitinophaga sp. SYP-B3965]MRG46805.1 hypothetical protein [Chitinophaga sp. SYP-B3965]